MNNFTESEIEIFSLDELKQLGFSYILEPPNAFFDFAQGACCNAEGKVSINYDLLHRIRH
jgi:hypothetical protein